MSSLYSKDRLLSKSRKLLYFSISLIIIIYLLSSFYYHDTVNILPSVWSCNGTSEYDQICTFTNLCIDKVNGPFVVSEHTPPKINLINTYKEHAIWFQPKTFSQKRGKYVGDEVAVYGLYHPYHFSHYLFNGLIPLYSTMREYGMKNAWTFRGATRKSKQTVLDMPIFNDGKDIVLEYKENNSPKQISPSVQPMCFDKAVVGTGNRCSLGYCEGRITKGDYDAFREDVFKAPLGNSKCLDSTVHYGNGSRIIAILNRYHSRHITNMPGLIRALLDEVDDITIRLMNFDEGCSIRDTAHLVYDVEALIAPFGNALGSGLFMKDNTMMVSIDARWYSEDWFLWPMMTTGIRLYNFRCKSPSCQVYDEDHLKSILALYDITLSPDELLEMMTTKAPFDIISKYAPGKEIDILDLYHKDSSRRVDIDSFIPFFKERLYNYNVSAYIEECKADNICTRPLERNTNRNQGGIMDVY